MTVLKNLQLRHTKCIAYMQIYAAFVLAMIASGFVTDLQFNYPLIPAVVLNNFSFAAITGLLGLRFFRNKIKKIEAIHFLYSVAEESTK